MFYLPNLIYGKPEVYLNIILKGETSALNNKQKKVLEYFQGTWIVSEKGYFLGKTEHKEKLKEIEAEFPITDINIEALNTLYAFLKKEDPNLIEDDFYKRPVLVFPNKNLELDVSHKRPVLIDVKKGFYALTDLV